jgi:predicted SAM-dependent methyltransferase
MKIRITVGAEEKLNGYINVDPVSRFDDLESDVRNLDPIAEDAECSEILAEEVIDFIRREEVYPILDHWISKLRHGGKMYLSFYDTRQIAKAFFRGKINLDEFNTIVHGTFSAPWDVKLGHTTVEEVSRFLQARGLVVTKKTLDGLKATIGAARP